MNRMGQTVGQVNAYRERTRHLPALQAEATSLIYDREGNRKYLTRSERTAFLAASEEMAADIGTFCLVLAYTGARISEVLALTPSRIDPAAQVVVFESLKKRRSGVFRAVPLPAEVFEQLELVHGIAARRTEPSQARMPLWPWCRTSAWKHVKTCLALAAISGTHACPKGLRHGFAVAALQAGVPINFVRRWLGHARLSTTEIYADAIGPEEQAIAQRFWNTFGDTISHRPRT